MRTTRVYCAGVTLGLTLAAAAWLYTYRVWNVFDYVDRNGRRFHAPERVRVQPWWSVPATVALTLIGSVVSLWLLPEHRRLIKRLAAHFANPTSSGRDSAA
jgi:hypothetical protein